MRIQLIIVLSIFLLFSCKDPEKKEDPVKVGATSVLVLNEGNMGYGNASIDLYNPSTSEVGSGVFAKNNGRPLGDVLQSAVIVSGKIYLLVNNSSKIEVVNALDFKQLGSIQNLPSPRYMLPLENGKAYVSDFTANQIHIIDLHSLSKKGSISASGWIEKMAYSSGKVFACNAISDEVWVIDAEKDSIINKIAVGVEPLEAVTDKNGAVWVLCTGGFEEENAQLLKIDPASELIAQTLTFPSLKSYPQRLTIDESGESIYYLDENLYRFSIHEQILPQEPLIRADGRLLYGLGVDAKHKQIYLTDAIDYLQRGDVFQYDLNGNLLHRFKAGIIPSDFVFPAE